jgi:hypothetical protein
VLDAAEEIGQRAVLYAEKLVGDPGCFDSSDRVLNQVIKFFSFFVADGCPEVL